LSERSLDAEHFQSARGEGLKLFNPYVGEAGGGGVIVCQVLTLRSGVLALMKRKKEEEKFGGG
jgi:hypothetical protein